jgi:hypothetical protein
LEKIILIIITPISTFCGFIFGLLACMAYGLILYDNYEYLAPGGPRGEIGHLALWGGALVGGYMPWFIRNLAKKEK